MNNLLTSYKTIYDDFIITNESTTTLDNIKKTTDKIIRNIKNGIQLILNWISTKFMKILNIESVVVNRNYYNELMSLINKILKIDVLDINRALMNINAILNNENNVKKYSDKLNEKIKDLDDIAEQVLKINPSPNGTMLRISTSKLKSLKSELINLQKTSQDKVYQISKLCNISDDPENLNYTKTQIVLIGRLAAFDLRRSQLCVSLINKLMSNCNLDNSVKDNWNGSFDKFFIADEAFKDAKVIFKKGMNDVKKLANDFEKMPENTSSDCIEKISKCKELINITFDACQELRSIKPGNLDKFISGITFIVGSVIDESADSNIRYSAYGLKPQSPNVSSGIHTIGAMIGVKYLARLVRKGTISERMATVKELLDRTIDVNKKYNKEYTRLYTLKGELIKEENSENTTAKESFIDFYNL